MLKKITPVATMAMMASVGHATDPVQPSDVLPDHQNTLEENGVQMRKGSIKATIENINAMNRILTMPEGNDRTEKLQAVIKVVQSLIPALDKVGCFSFFTLDEWIQDEQNQGRILVGLLYMEHDPKSVTQTIKDTLTTYLAHGGIAPEVKERIKTVL